MDLVYFNGNILPATTPLFPASHRGLRYGDGLFETMRCANGKIPFLPLHIERLQAGMKALGMEQPSAFGIPFFEKEIKKILPATENARVRLTLTRKGGGTYTPETDAVDFLIEATPLQLLPPAIAQSGFLKDFPISPSPWSAYKTANSLPYVLASRAKKERGWEEGVLLNQAGRVADACHSNVFAVMKGVLCTPPVAEGALAGILRSAIVQLWGKDLEIRPIEVRELLEADEIWFTNAVQGIRRVENFEGKRLKNAHRREFFAALEGLWKDGVPNSYRWINR